MGEIMKFMDAKMMKLSGSRLMVVSSVKNERISVEQVKKLTGEDRLKTRSLRQTSAGNVSA